MKEKGTDVKLELENISLMVVRKLKQTLSHITENTHACMSKCVHLLRDGTLQYANL